jgi:exopolysaccharide biosynthesis polyprenyl glycosylphosphotransferase
MGSRFSLEHGKIGFSRLGVDQETIQTDVITSKPVRWRLRQRELTIILLLGDLFVTFSSLLIAIYFWARPDWLRFSLTFIRERIPFWYYLLPLLWIVFLVELYDVRRASRVRDTITGIAIAALISLGIYSLVYFTSEPNSLPRRGVAAFILASFVLTIIWRLLYIKVFTAPSFIRRVLIIGAGRAGSTVAQVIREIWPAPFLVIGFIDDDPHKMGIEIKGFPVLGDNCDLIDIARKHHITDLIFSISNQMNPDMFEALLKAEELGIEITTMPVIYEELLSRVPVFLLQSDWILRSFLDQAHANRFYELMKRLLDILGSLIGMFFLVVFTPLISLMILLDDGWPVFYSQDRLGKNGRIFSMIKFRTMSKNSCEDGELRPTSDHDERITRAGKFLRKSHLDELPQVINVMLGDMSLVGPRAEIPELAAKFQEQIPFYRARVLARPGLTGWAQVNQDYAATVKESAVKLEYDLYYIKRRNLLLDFTILLRTAGSVFGLRGK